MRRIDPINKISSNNVVQSVKSMQVLDEQSKAYFNFINSLNSQSTRKSYEFCIEKFLTHYSIDLESLLNLPQQDISNLLIRYLVEKKISKSYKMQIFSALKHACEMNDVVLNWKKLKKASFGYRDLVGQVKNIGNDTAESVNVLLTVYDKNGGVVGTENTYAEIDTLKPGQKSTFKFFASSDTFKGMDYYELSLEWSNADGSQGYVENAKIYKSNNTNSND